MVTIRINDLERVLDRLLNKGISREEAAEWAFKLREADDAKAIEYHPRSDESLIWDGILFIEGIDLKDSPESYLHSEGDIQSFRDKLKTEKQ